MCNEIEKNTLINKLKEIKNSASKMIDEIDSDFTKEKVWEILSDESNKIVDTTLLLLKVLD